jgi:hypothetical protein
MICFRNISVNTLHNGGGGGGGGGDDDDTDIFSWNYISLTNFEFNRA